jgi:hypothetical protein
VISIRSNFIAKVSAVNQADRQAGQEGYWITHDHVTAGQDHIVTNVPIRNYDVARTMQISSERSQEPVTQWPRVSYLEEPQFCFPRSSRMPDREDDDVKSSR